MRAMTSKRTAAATDTRDDDGIDDDPLEAAIFDYFLQEISQTVDTQKMTNVQRVAHAMAQSLAAAGPADEVETKRPMGWRER